MKKQILIWPILLIILLLKMYVYIYTWRITSKAEFEWKHRRSLLLVIIEPCDRKYCLFRKTEKFTPPHRLTHSVLARNLLSFYGWEKWNAEANDLLRNGCGEMVLNIKCFLPYFSVSHQNITQVSMIIDVYCVNLQYHLNSNNRYMAQNWM